MKILRALLILLFVALAVAGAGYWWWQRALNAEFPHPHAEDYITVERGMGSGQILEKLATEGIIQEKLAAKIHLKLAGHALQLEAGDYRFPSPISALAALKQLENGTIRTQTLPIPEGWTRFEIAARIAARFADDTPTAKAGVLDLMDNTALLDGLSAEADNLEGYLYPTTYAVEVGTAPPAIVELMVRQFEAQWQPGWDSLLLQTGRSRHELVTIASLIENESKFDAERRRVASVIYNRLERGIPLGIDATNVYTAKLLGRWDGILHKSDLEVDHPYNTRKIVGLPPGPICSPSASAIAAALQPETTDYLYYVLNVDAGDGSHNFYETDAAFAQGKRAYQRWLAKQR